MRDNFDFPARAIHAVENMKRSGWMYSYKQGWLPPGCTGYKDSGKPHERWEHATCVCGYRDVEHTHHRE